MNTVLSLSYYNVFSFLVFLDKFVLHDMIAFWQKGGKNRTDCVFLDKFIFHDLIAFLETGGKNRTVLLFEGRYSKRKGALVGSQNFLFRYFEQVGPVCIELFN